MKTNTYTLAAALDALACNIQSEDGVANAAIAEAANRLRELDQEIVVATRQARINHERAESIISAREETVHRMRQKIDRLSTALRDAISTYDPNRAETFVSAERQEAWAEALK